MSLASTRQVIDAYFDAMGRGDDFGQYFAEQVMWAWMETGERVSGREAVRDHIVEVHDDADWRSTTLLVADGAVTLEGSVGPGPPDTTDPGDAVDARRPFCLVYEIRDGQIVAVRGYVSDPPNP